MYQLGANKSPSGCSQSPIESRRNNEPLLSKFETVRIELTRKLYFFHEASSKVLENDAIRGSEESQYVGHEKSLLVCQTCPISSVLFQINFFCCPEGSLGLLVHSPNLCSCQTDLTVTYQDIVWGRARSAEGSLLGSPPASRLLTE